MAVNPSDAAVAVVGYEEVSCRVEHKTERRAGASPLWRACRPREAEFAGAGESGDDARRVDAANDAFIRLGDVEGAVGIEGKSIRIPESLAATAGTPSPE